MSPSLSLCPIMFPLYTDYLPSYCSLLFSPSPLPHHYLHVFHPLTLLTLLSYVAIFSLLSHFLSAFLSSVLFSPRLLPFLLFSFTLRLSSLPYFPFLSEHLLARNSGHYSLSILAQAGGRCQTHGVFVNQNYSRNFIRPPGHSMTLTVRPAISTLGRIGSPVAIHFLTPTAIRSDLNH